MLVGLSINLVQWLVFNVNFEHKRSVLLIFMGEGKHVVTLLPTVQFPGFAMKCRHKEEYSETFSELYQACKMEFFAKLINCFQSVTIFGKNFILDISQLSQYASSISKKWNKSV